MRLNVTVHRTPKPPIVVDTNVGPYLEDYNGKLLPPSEAVELATKIIQNALILEREGERLEDKAFTACDVVDTGDSRSAHVYLFECGGRYKIGVSNNVQRRLKQLDVRPFPVTLVACSDVVRHAYQIEQSLHYRFDDQRLNGEWFELTDEQVEYITEYLNDLE